MEKGRAIFIFHIARVLHTAYKINSPFRAHPCKLGKFLGYVFFSHFISTNIGLLYLIKILSKSIKSFLMSLTAVDEPQNDPQNNEENVNQA